MDSINLAAKNMVGLWKVYATALGCTVGLTENSVLSLTEGVTAFHLGRLVEDVRSQVQVI